MRAANILTFVAVLAWIGLFLLGLDGIKGVINQRVPGYPAMGQIEYYVVAPCLAVMGLLASAWAFNVLRRWPSVLVVISTGALFALLPFLLLYSGGV